MANNITDVPDEPEPTPADFPEASTRLKPNARGSVVVTICEQAWLFSDVVPELRPVWDRLYDANVLAGSYPVLDLQLAALRLLTANYTLLTDEAVILIRAAEVSDLVKAVETALFGPERVHRSFTDWVVASFAANGLSVDDVPADRRQAVLELLVATRRTLSPAEYISSAQAAKVRSDILAMAARP